MGEELNWEQKKSIELENKLPELSAHLKDIGRENKTEEIIKEFKKEDEKEVEERKEKDEDYIKQLQEIQKDYQKRKDETNDFYLLRMNVISLLSRKERRQATEEIVKYIEENNYIYTTKDDLKSEVWIYDVGVYKPQGESSINEICRKVLRNNYTISLANEVISKIKADTYIDNEAFFQNRYVYEVPLQNGILNILTKEISTFNPKKIFFNKLPIKYNPAAKCPGITQHFKCILRNESDVEVMFEIFGFFLYKDYFIEKAIMFVGEGRNGKGKTIDLMKRFLGSDNCASVPLNSMGDNNFRTWDLFGKMANLAGDLSSNALKDTAILKQTTGRDLIGADRKFKTTTNFINYAKHVFACNELPRVYDFSRGFWERWILFEFPYTFVKKEVYDKAENKENLKIMDPFIIDKISTEEELSGLLNKALEGLQKIIKQKDFSYSVGVDEVKKFWVRKSDSFTAFVMDNIEDSYDGTISKPVLRKAFNKYCKKHKVKGASDKNIKSVLEELFGATDSQDYQTKDRIWEGITFKEDSAYKYLEKGGGL